MRYTVTVPPTSEQGSYKTTVTGSRLQSYRAEALQDYNNARAHDGLEPLDRMPRGTTYTPRYEYALQSDYGYGHGWEDLCVEETRKEAQARRKEYEENERGTYRIKSRAEASK